MLTRNLFFWAFKVVLLALLPAVIDARMQKVRQASSPTLLLSMHLFTAGYNNVIAPYAVDPASAKLVALKGAIGGETSNHSPSWLAYSSRRSDGTKMMYSIDESDTGLVFSYTVTPNEEGGQDGFDIVPNGDKVQSVNGTSSGGDGPVSVLVGHGVSKGLLFVANYGSGSAAVFKIQDDGSIASQSQNVFQFHRSGNSIGPVPDRQDHSYAHQVQISPNGAWVYVVDLGADQIHHLKINPADQSVAFTTSTDVPSGNGPRHITFYKNRLTGDVTGYLAEELSNTVTSFTLNENTGDLKALQSPILASPPGVPISGEGILPTNRTTAEIVVSPDGRFVYVSDRGDTQEDHISTFTRDVETGKIAFLKWTPSGGRMPRHFSISSDTSNDPDAHWLVAAHQDSQNLVLFKRDPLSGELIKKDTVENVGPVAFAGFAPF